MARWMPIVVVLGITAIAGCISEPEPNPRFAATATGGALFLDWDYSAVSREFLGATLTVDVDEVTNTGVVRADGTRGEEAWVIDIRNFTHNTDDFHSGGIAANFEEHGDSGVGNALLPRMNLLIATWGPGIIAEGTGDNRTEIVDPYTGASEFAAHLMVTDTGVRDDDTSVVSNADGSGTYDPSDPGNALIGNDLEAHLVLTSTYGNESLAPTSESGTLSWTVPRDQSSHEFEVSIYSATITATIDLGGDPGEAGGFTFQIRDPDDAPLASVTINGAEQDLVRTIEATATRPGTYQIWSQTNVAPGDAEVTIDVTYPPKPIYYLFWEDVMVESRVVS